MASKRDYEQTAAVLAHVAAKDTDPYTIKAVALAMADMFAAENPNFKRQLFLNRVETLMTEMIGTELNPAE